jgi:hypothetical protein
MYARCGQHHLPALGVVRHYMLREEPLSSFFCFLAARFSSSDFAGFLRCSFFRSMPLLIAVSR